MAERSTRRAVRQEIQEGYGFGRELGGPVHGGHVVGPALKFGVWVLGFGAWGLWFGLEHRKVFAS